VAGKRRMERFQTYSEAKRRADALTKEMAQGSQVTVLTPKQATDALAALQRLQSHFHSAGRRISLLAGISECCEANAKLGERPLSECVDSYLRNLAVVKRKDISEAAEEFIEGRKATRIRRNDYSPD